MFLSHKYTIVITSTKDLLLVITSTKDSLLVITSTKDMPYNYFSLLLYISCFDITLLPKSLSPLPILQLLVLVTQMITNAIDGNLLAYECHTYDRCII